MRMNIRMPSDIVQVKIAKVFRHYGQVFCVHRPYVHLNSGKIFFSNSSWAVSEYTTGLSVYNGIKTATIKATINMAIELIEGFCTEKELAEKISSSEMINIKPLTITE